MMKERMALNMAYYDFDTKNKSFLEVHNELTRIGIKNNNFFLLLYDKTLQGIDPYDESLSSEVKAKIIRECSINIFYFLREIVRFPDAYAGEPLPFKLDKWTLAAIYCFINNQNFYLTKPYGTHPNIEICAMLTWAFKFGITNGNFMIMSDKYRHSRNILYTITAYIDLLPSYFNCMGRTFRSVGDKKINSVIDNITNNHVYIKKCANSKTEAEHIAAGVYNDFELFDDANDIPYIEMSVDALSYPFAVKQAIANRSGKYSCRIFYHTPENPNTREYPSDLKFAKNSLSWTDLLYDVDKDTFHQIISMTSGYDIVFINGVYL